MKIEKNYPISFFNEVLEEGQICEFIITPDILETIKRLFILKNIDEISKRVYVDLKFTDAYNRVIVSIYDK